MAPSCYDVNKRRNLKRSGSATAFFSLFIFFTESPSSKATTKRSTQGKFKDP